MRRRLLFAAIALAVCVVLAARDAILYHVESDVDPRFDLARFQDIVAWVVLFYLMWACLAPLVFSLARRVPFRRSGWVVPLVVHGCAAFAIAGIASVALAIPFGGLVLHRGWPSSPGSLVTPFWLNYAGVHAMGDASLYWILVGAAVGFDLHDAYGAKQLQAAELERSLTNAHIDALRMKLQPHFLFNTLNSIAFLALEKDAGAIVRMVERLVRLLKASTEADGCQMVPLADELTLLDQYLAIEEVRFKDRLRVARRVEPAASRSVVPTLVLQPIVENSIKHGFSRRLDASCIEIDITVDGERLVIVVQDDGPGLPPGWRVETDCGRGLRNVLERIDALYRGQWSFSLRNRPAGGAIAELRIPVAGGTASTGTP